MSVEELRKYLKENGEEIRQSILAGKYKPSPVKRVEIPKEAGKTRKLGIPTAVDRVKMCIRDRYIKEHLDEVQYYRYDEGLGVFCQPGTIASESTGVLEMVIQ